MTFALGQECFDCKARFPLNEKVFKCHCGSYSLQVKHDLEKIKRILPSKKAFLNGLGVHHWKYWMFYPVKNLHQVTSLWEGGTPLLKSRQRKGYYYKFEGMNPTGSFKDRGTTIELTHARELGVKETACASTGNMGASVAAYSARAGLKCTIVVPDFAPEAKMAQIKSHGAKLLRLKGSYEKAFERVNSLWEEKRLYPTGDYAFREDGEKSIAFEIVDQFGKVPDYIVCPIGMGTILSSVYKGLTEFKQVGLIDKLPKLVGVQALGCAPVVEAVKTGKVKEKKNPKTIAEAINCGLPSYGSTALNAVKQTKGALVAVSDSEIMQSRKELALEGVYVEPAGAAALAGAKKLKLKGSVVCIATGHGLKDPFVGKGLKK